MYGNPIGGSGGFPGRGGRGGMFGPPRMIGGMHPGMMGGYDDKYSNEEYSDGEYSEDEGYGPPRFMGGRGPRGPPGGFGGMGGMGGFGRGPF
jgi:hypothetical protein